MLRTLSASAFALVLAVGSAWAGLIDTPLPAGTNYLFSVPGVIASATIGTYFTCTSVAKSSQDVTIDVFNGNGDLACSGTLTVDVGKTVRFATQASTILSSDTIVCSGPASLVNQGAARILSTGKSLLCNVSASDATGAVVLPLDVIAKTKQKAAN